MGAAAVTEAVAAIDIGTNSVRLLIDRGAEEEAIRRTEVTGLGRDLSRTGRLHPEGRRQTMEVLADFAGEMSRQGVMRARAVMTAAGRQASDTPSFLEEATSVLGLEPETISGEEEARLSYAGAVADLDGEGWTVVDIGGGSTEVVSSGSFSSRDVGSVVVTDSHLSRRPAQAADLGAARRWTATMMEGLPQAANVVGVAGTWTSLAAIEAESSDPERTHHTRMGRETLTRWVDRLAAMTIAQTQSLPGLDPRRAPVILGGAIVAEQSLITLGTTDCLVSERSLLDGVVHRLRS